MKERQKLSIDIDELFPGEALKIGSTSVLIRPLGLEQIILISKRIKGIGELLSDEDVNWENYTEKSSLFKIAIVLLNSFPDVLEEASNIDINDLKQLPLEHIVLIINKVIEVNLKSRDDLVKNFKSLTEQLMAQVENLPQEKMEKTKKKMKKI